MSYETSNRESMKHRLRSGALLAGAILLANIVVIGGVLFGLSGASHAATISPLAAERLATMLAAPALSLPAFSTDNHTFVFSLLVGGLVSMTLGAVTLTRTFAHDVRKAGGMSALDRL